MGEECGLRSTVTQGSGQGDRGWWQADYTHLTTKYSILTILRVRKVLRTPTHVIDSVQKGIVYE